MNEIDNTASPPEESYEYDPRELFRLIWGGRWLIAVVTSGTTVIAAVVVLVLSNIYRSEIAFPGSCPTEKGATLSSMLERAGGLMKLVFPQGSIFFTSKALKTPEREQQEVLPNQVESNLASMLLADSSRLEALSIRQAPLRHFCKDQPVGWLVIYHENALTGHDDHLKLRDGDRLLILDAAQEVTVLGEVQYARSHLF